MKDSWDPVRSSGSDEKRADRGYVLRVKATGFPEKLYVRREREEPKMTPVVCVLRSQYEEVVTEMVTTTCAARFWGKDPNFSFGCVPLEISLRQPSRIVEWLGGDARLYFGRGLNE